MTHFFPSRCPYCNGIAHLHIAASDINRRMTDRIFHLYRCTACRLMFVTDPPADLAAYYSSDYHFRPAAERDLEPLLPLQQFKIDLIHRFKLTGTLLEIGPSSGIFCLLAKRAGFSVSAMEMDADCVRFLREELGIRATQTSDPAAALAEEAQSYDAICLWHSIEHMKAPWDVLGAAIEHLEPGGVLLIAAPNPDAWQARLLGARWPHYDLPRHLFELPPTWLREFSRQHGLSEKYVTTNDADSRSYTYFTWRQFFKSLTHRAWLQPMLRRSGGLVARILDPWESREGNGAGYTMILCRLDRTDERDNNGERAFP